MSILIKGMEMPKGCAWCHFCEHGSINEFEYFCGLTNSRIAEMYDRTGWEDMRAADCPLIEVPPHGRLIDADALLSIDRQIYDGDRAIGRRNVIYPYEVENMPTIIEAEEAP